MTSVTSRPVPTSLISSSAAGRRRFRPDHTPGAAVCPGPHGRARSASTRYAHEALRLGPARGGASASTTSGVKRGKPRPHETADPPQKPRQAGRTVSANSIQQVAGSTVQIAPGNGTDQMTDQALGNFGSEQHRHRSGRNALRTQSSGSAQRRLRDRFAPDWPIHRTSVYCPNRSLSACHCSSAAISTQLCE